MHSTPCEGGLPAKAGSPLRSKLILSAPMSMGALRMSFERKGLVTFDENDRLSEQTMPCRRALHQPYEYEDLSQVKHSTPQRAAGAGVGAEVRSGRAEVCTVRSAAQSSAVAMQSAAVD